ncbi:MAG: 2-oxoacid:acceptor oxidoreductase family protein [Candidatus Thermoplasmatota archaeon]
MKIRIGGWAGQGTVRAGTVLGKSLSLEQDYHVVQQWSYSAAVRSGIAYSDVIADREELDELVIEVPDYLLVLYQDTLDEWEETARKVDNLIVDSSRVERVSETSGEVYRVPAGQIAEDIATSKAANVVLLGALCGVSDEIDMDGLEKTVRDEFPGRYTELNVEALESGYRSVQG